MIRFENDARTRGEQVILRAILQGRRLARCDWQALRPKDFAHDLHGRILRHAQRLAAERFVPDTFAVFYALKDEKRGRGVQGVAEYLAWLTGNDPCFATGDVEAVIAFQVAITDEHEAAARTDAMRRHKCS